jgi:hypothetical protein
MMTMTTTETSSDPVVEILDLLEQYAQHRERADAEMAQTIWNWTKARRSRSSSLFVPSFTAADIVRPEFQARFRIVVTTKNSVEKENDDTDDAVEKSSTDECRMIPPLLFRVYDDHTHEGHSDAAEDLPPSLVTEENSNNKNTSTHGDDDDDDTNTGLRQRRKKNVAEQDGGQTTDDSETSTTTMTTHWEIANDDEKKVDHTDPKWLIAGGSVPSNVREWTLAEQHARRAMSEYIQTANAMAAIIQTLQSSASITTTTTTTTSPPK